MDASNPRWSMRSAELRPSHEYYENDNPGFFNESEYITHVVDARHKLIGVMPQAGRPNPIGRLLLVDYKVSNHNEATEDESAGFFDWADNPPWDLWVGEYDELLVAWIPHEFVEVVVRSEQVECMGMFHWADDFALCGRIPTWLRVK
ncbi:MAG: hypothetical protein JNK90_19845 [Planctomycetaceae bacterium]|nr:hypothetical protein [Planctomycetaceae bacterium]